VRRGEGYVVSKVNLEKIRTQLETELKKKIEDCKKAGIPLERILKITEEIYRGDE